MTYQDPVDSPNRLASILNPASVAVVGANENTETFTGASVANLIRHGYRGAIYPVNPRRETVLGIAAYPDLGSLPQPAELVVVVVRADNVLPTLRQAVDTGARAAIIVSSGFGEGSADEVGRQRGRELREFIDRTRLPILGPSTTGLVNLNDAFVPRAANNHLDPSRLKPGPVALISQSGAANNAVFNRAHAHGVRVGLSVATGVQANTTVWDYTQQAIDDPRIRVTCVIVEELGDPDQYEPVVRAAAEASKPVILLRTGRSPSGRRAVATHTDSLTGNWTVESAFLRSLGVILVEDLDQLWEIAHIVQHWGPPPNHAVRLGVIGFSGGEGALIADLATDLDLQLPETSDQFKKLVNTNLSLAGAGNPFDPTGESSANPDRSVEVLTGFITENDYDAHVVALNAQTAPRQGGFFERVLSEIAQTPGRKALSCWEIPGFSDGMLEAVEAFPGPVVPGSHRLIRAIGTWAAARDTPAPRPAESPAEKPRLDPVAADMTYWQARQLLGEVGIPFTSAVRAHTCDEALAAAAHIGYPVVLKANVTSTEHKAAAGLVDLSVADDSQLRMSFARLIAAADDVVVEPAILSTASVLLGTSWDYDIGSVVVIGSGGGVTEHLRDSAACPTRLLDPDIAHETVLRTAVGRYLADREPGAAKQLAELMLRLGRSVHGSALAIDINPLALSNGALVALDARIAPVPVARPN